MNSDTRDAINLAGAVALLIGVAVGTAVGATLGWRVTTAEMRREAVEAGVAEWVVDPKTGATTFQYKGKP